MVDNPKYQIILLPRQDYWKWVDAVRDYAVRFNLSVTPSPQNALDFHHPNQVVSIVNAATGYLQYGDISAWFAQRSPSIQLDILPAMTPDDLKSALAERIQQGIALAATAQLAQPPAAAASRAFALAWPTDYPTIAQGFGANPELFRRWGLPGHDGVDIKAPVNSKIYACADGAVYAVHDGSRNHPYGIHVRIVHQGGYRTIYGHLNEALVSTGQVVRAGDVIGLADGTGNSSGSVLHLALKKDGATAAGLTRYPSDLIDPTPYLGPAVPRAEGGVPTADWSYGHCLVGLTARPDGAMAEPDWEVLRRARIEALKVGSSIPPSVIDRALGINPAMFFVASLKADFRGRIIAPPEFARLVEHDALALYERGVRYFELHNEPNLVTEGLGTSWRDGYEFGQWFLQAMGYLRLKLPQARFGWPGLSLGPRVEGMRADARLFLEQASGIVRQADWIGCHCFWQDEAGMYALDGGLGYKLYQDEWPGKLVIITEFSNTSPDISLAVKGQQYATYYQLLRSQPAIGAAFAFVVSSGTGYQSEVWRTEDGQLTPIPQDVGRRAD